MLGRRGFRMIVPKPTAGGSVSDEIDRSVLPIRRPAYSGKVNRTLDGSEPDWNILESPRAPEDAPNVLLILIDDAGYGNPSTFGGPVSTPNLTRVADDGVRFTRHHVTALCSPTRAALLTGRNHHSVGFGSIGELSTGFPGYSAFFPKDCAPFPRVLQENGYSTAAFGKWHMTPDHQQGPAGPFDRWPNKLGFDYFWGFLGGEAGQYDPVITENQTTIGPPEDDDFYLPDAMSDKAIEWIHGVRAQEPDKPWFMYFSTGCSHAPHHVPPEWSAKYKGRFDKGWDVYREETFARQNELGVVPPNAELTPRHDAFPAWDSIPDEQRPLLARQMEVYAGYQENADWNVGRLLDAIEAMDELDNTVVIYIWGDNGASMEGTITGSFNELTMQNGIPLTGDEQLKLAEEYGGLEAWGTELISPHYAAAWAWAGNCPFQWGKQVASHLGGTRNPMVVRWPGRIPDRGGVRDHFTHVIDIGPTILEGIGIPAPTHVDGIAQREIHGTSFLYALGEPGAPEHHTQQYFEIFGNRAMYKDGWLASWMMPRIPWDATPDTMKKFAPAVWNPDEDPVELYYLPDDFSQAKDLAAQHPEKVEELRKLFWKEAEKYDVLPLLGGMAFYFGIVPPLGTRTRYTYHGPVRNIASGMIPRIYNHSYAISAELEIPDGGAEGVIVAEADHLGGFSLFIQDGRLKHTYSMMGVYVYRQEADTPLPAGEVSVRLEFAADAPKPATGGEVTLFVNDETVGGGRMDRTVPMRFSGYAGMDVGCDGGLPVDRSYADKSPFAFTGTIKKVVFDVDPHLSADDRHAIHEHAHQGALAHGMSA
jgi:arylsulfatase A-like enzyme